MKFDFIKKFSGIAVLEAALTMPVVIYLIFFMLEAIKLNSSMTALDSMITEMVFDFMGSKKTTNFQKIIKKYKPPNVPIGNITWYFDIYDDITTMNKNSPYGGEDVFWPQNEICKTGENCYIASNKEEEFLSRSKDSLSLNNYKYPESSFNITNASASFQRLSGKAFVLTIVCDYCFFSAFIGNLFGGGKNTKDRTKFLIYSRGVGVCS